MMIRPLKSSWRWGLGALFVLGPLAASAPAAAQDIATAEALFNSGFADMKAGRYEAGCKALAESQRLDPRAGTLFTLASCEARWGHVATAVTRFGDFLTLYEQLPANKKAAQAGRYKQARAEREKLVAEVPELTLSLPKDAPTGTVVKRDDAVLSSAALGVGLPIDPGEHTISTQAPNGVLWETHVTVAKGDKKQVMLEVRAAKVEAPIAAEPVKVESQGPSGRRMATYALGGAGIVGIVAGAVTGGLAVAKNGTRKEHCGAGIGSTDLTACDQTGLDAAGQVRGLGLGSTLGFVIGGAALGTAAVLFLTETKAATSKTGQRGPWVSAGVLSVGSTGALVGAQGAW